MGWWGRCRKRKTAMYVCMYEYFSCMQMACNYLTCGSMFRPFLILMCTGPSQYPYEYVVKGEPATLYFESRQVGKSNRKSESMGKLWNGASLSGRDIGMGTSYIFTLHMYIVHMTTRNSAAFLPFCLEYYIQIIWKRDERASQHVSNLTTQAPFDSKTEKRLGNCVFC